MRETTPFIRSWPKVIIILVLAIFVSGCTTMKPQDFAAKTPVFKPEEFFLGKSLGVGVFYDRFRNVRTSFVIDLEGKLENGVFRLHEDLVYENGEKLTRVYEFKKISENLYEATTPDLVGPARIEAYGNTLRWSYVLNQKIGDSVWALTFDDWMFLQPDGTVLNRATATKWGFEVGEVFMSVRRKADAPA